MKTLSFFLASFFVLVFAGFGCSSVRDAATEQAINNQLDGQGSVEVDDGTIRFEDENGGTVVTGANVQIPEDFPRDLLLYPEATLMAVANTSEGASLTMTSDDAKSEVVGWYENQMYGWTLSGQMSFQGQETRLYEKDNVRVAILVSGSETLTNIVVTRTVETK